VEETMKLMEALLWDGNPYPNGQYQDRVPVPEIKPGWVLIKNVATGICGSDLHYLSGGLRHQIPDENLPAVMGHENAGLVVEIGEGVQGFAIGDRVVGEPLHACYAQGINLCPACQAGQYHLCANLGHVGIPARLRLPGGLGE
jgi:(R,R)-butanediol dehydrogenase/meso-butanediol dehydrogenase/diacetyl reductase